jgi:hypothetical protein
MKRAGAVGQVVFHTSWRILGAMLEMQVGEGRAMIIRCLQEVVVMFNSSVTLVVS